MMRLPFKLLILFLLLSSKSALASGVSDFGFYKTPIKGKKPSEGGDVTFTSPEKAQIHDMALDLPDTPFGKESKSHRRDLIDQAPTPKRQAAARFYRYSKKKGVSSTKKRRRSFYLKWHGKYELIRNNSRTGRVIEVVALSQFGLFSNNHGQVQSFTKVLSPFRGRVITHTTRPDGIGRDEDGNTVIFEVKFFRNKDAVLYVSSQLRAQERVAREKDGRHVVSMNTRLDVFDMESFPRPSSRFYSKGMITEFRLCDGDANMYRWDWDSDGGEWFQVLERTLEY